MRKLRALLSCFACSLAVIREMLRFISSLDMVVRKNNNAIGKTPNTQYKLSVDAINVQIRRKETIKIIPNQYFAHSARETLLRIDLGS